MAEFTCLGTEMVTALDRISRVTAKEPAKLVLVSGKEKVYLLVEHESRLIRYPLAATVNSPVEGISIPIERLKAACNKKGAMTFAVSDNSLSFKTKDGVSSGEVFLKDLDMVDFPAFKFPKNAITITTELIELFGHIELKTDVSQSDMICYVDTTANLKLASANNNVAALLKHKEKLAVSPITTNILVKYLNIFNNLFGKDEYQLDIKENTLTANCRGVIIQLPMFESGEINLPKIESVLAEKKPTVSFSLSIDSLKNALNNMKHAYDKGKPIELNVLSTKSLMSGDSESAGTLSIKMFSNYGKAFETLSISELKVSDSSSKKKKGASADVIATIQLSFEMLVDMLSAFKHTGNITLGLVKEDALKINIKTDSFNLVYMMASVGG